jgi:hypothetical protein
VAGELQSFATPPSFGGPYAGVIAAREKFIRQMPGRLAGETKDSRGNRAYCLTISTREQHIRREKATSNICTNQALIALMATVFMTVYGKEDARTCGRIFQGPLPGSRCARFPPVFHRAAAAEGGLPKVNVFEGCKSSAGRRWRFYPNLRTQAPRESTGRG